MIEEDAQAQGRRYASEGRLVVDVVNGYTIHATCRGDDAVYALGHDVNAHWWCECGGPWWCECGAEQTCAHLHALKLVTECDGARGRLCADCGQPLARKLIEASFGACWPPCGPKLRGRS